MNKDILLILVLLLSINLCSALQISVSPSELNLKLNTHEETCKNITISASSDLLITGEDRWTKIQGSKDLKDYELSSSDLGIEVSYKKQFIVHNKKQLEVCINARNQGVYNGALIFSHKSLAVGNWIIIDVSGTSSDSLTGSFIGQNTNKNMLVILETFILLLLIVVLISIIN